MCPRGGLALVLALSCLCAAGCSGLPTVMPGAPPPSTAGVQLVGARGPLSNEQSRAVLARLSSNGADTNVFDRHLALEESVVDSPLTTGNQVLLLKDGPATFAAMLRAIAAAQDHIHMETYILDDDSVGQGFAQALLAKQRQGVQVRLMHDSVGTLGTPAAFFDALRAGGVQVLAFNPVSPLQARAPWQINQRNHRKLLIVDGLTAFMGGINISSVYSGGSTGRNPRPRPDGSLAWRDTDVQLQGPAVAELQKLFLAGWAQQQGPALTGTQHFPPTVAAGREVVRVIGSSPLEPFSRIYATLLSAINSAETSVQITMAYFVPDPQLLRALQDACERGVQVRLILPSSSDSWLVLHAGRSHYTRLLQAGVRIFERQGAILHAKTALIDGVWATVGSTNLDWRSFLHNHELNTVVLGPDFGQQLQTMFDQDLAAADEVLLAQWRRRGLAPRAKEVFARWWEYWL
jgi:cardiolipin synthase A/B